MKTVQEISQAPNLLIERNDEKGGTGRLMYGNLRNCTVMWGRAESGKYDHVSIAPTGRCPTWDEMCKVKEIFFYDDEECYQVFPKKSEHVNLSKTCLHIWRDIEEVAR